MSLKRMVRRSLMYKALVSLQGMKEEGLEDRIGTKPCPSNTSKGASGCSVVSAPSARIKLTLPSPGCQQVFGRQN